MDRIASRFGYPVMLDLGDVAVLVVGAGPIGARKAAGLLAAGARVTVVAPEVGPDVTQLAAASRLVVRRRSFERGDLDGVRLVITATGDPAVDADVSAAATAAGLWVNAADQPADCTFALPAVARCGRVTIAVGTDGASPALAQRLRDRAAELLTGEVAALADQLATERSAIRQAGGSTEDHDWAPRIDPVLAPSTPLRPLTRH
ncbi:hypothetical protein BH24ACT5_BH24ACT5_22340 [soil metagenome]